MFIPVLMELTNAERLTLILYLALNLGAISLCLFRRSGTDRR
ncbi:MULTISPECIES: hypothetical protein [unclassified Paenibacillus]|nr:MULTISPECIES: hypothetical protein [unclassified Paenibacillus]